MKIIFMGTPDFAVSALKKLIEKHEVLAVVTQPDKKQGRGNKIIYSPVKTLALEHGIEVLQPIGAKESDFIESLKKYNADIFIVVAYGQILKKELLDIPKFGCINIHGSLLPEYRGASPIQRAIIDGKDETGVTIMFLDEGVDTGDMILKESVKIEQSDNFETLRDKLAVVGADLLEKALVQIENGTAMPEKQDDSKSSHTKKIKKEACHINFNDTSKNIINLIRALNPQPGAYMFYNEKMIKVWEAAEYDSHDSGSNDKAGTVIEVIPKKGFVIKTSDGALLITDLQNQSGKRMKADAYLRGNKIETGIIIS